MKSGPIGIALKNIDLTYDVYYDRGRTLKEFILNALHKRRYVEKKKAKINALQNLSLEIRHGDRLGIIGHNGAGKSSLLKVISGILKPSHGDVEVHGTVQPLIEMAAGFNPEFSGRENIYLNGYMLGFSREQIKAEEQAIIDFAELGEFIDVPVKYYSSGMQVRLAFTIATSIDPQYLIFDELLSAGDAAFIQKAKTRMNRLVEKAKILVVVSHDFDTITNFCNRAIVMNKGQIVFDGQPDRAIAHYLAHQVGGGPDEGAEFLEISEMKMSATSAREGRVTCEVRSPVAAWVEATLNLGAGGEVKGPPRKFDLQPDVKQRLEFWVKSQTPVVGSIECHLNLRYGTPGGVEATTKRLVTLRFLDSGSTAISVEWSVSDSPPKSAAALDMTRS